MLPIPSIRKKCAEDISGIRKVIEADLVDGLQDSGALTFAAVAVIGSRIVGHLAFSPVTVAEQQPALALAPVAVMPDLQRQGIGAALIRWSLGECQRLGHGLVFALGEPAYYHRFGFTPASDFGIECPFAAPPGAFMLLELSPGAARNCQGRLRCRSEFELV